MTLYYLYYQVLLSDRSSDISVLTHFSSSGAVLLPGEQSDIICSSEDPRHSLLGVRTLCDKLKGEIFVMQLISPGSEISSHHGVLSCSLYHQGVRLAVTMESYLCIGLVFFKALLTRYRNVTY